MEVPESGIFICTEKRIPGAGICVPLNVQKKMKECRAVCPAVWHDEETDCVGYCDGVDLLRRVIPGRDGNAGGKNGSSD